MRILALAFCVLILAPAAAQAPKSVPFDTGKIWWENPPPETPTTPPVLYHYIYCAPADGSGSIQVTEVSMPFLIWNLNQVIPSPGVYVCYYTRVNIVGESGVSPSTIPFAAILSSVPTAPLTAPVVGAGGP